MKIIAYISGMVLLLFFNTLPLTATNNSDLPQDSPKEATVANLENLELPPLSVFMESVYDHPTALIYQTYKEEEAALLAVERRKWMDYLRVVGNYQFGYNSMYGEGTNIIVPSVNNTAKHSYNIGVSLSIPIGNAASNKKRVKAQEQVLKRVEYEQQIAIEERKLVILDAYNSVTELWAVLKAKSESVVLYDAQMKISEHDFINGKITIEELSLERGRRSTAVVTYQEARTALQSAIILLEMLTNIKVMK